MEKQHSKPEKSTIPNLTQGHIFFFLLLAGTFFLVYRILQPYLSTIILAGILASLLYPVHTWIMKVLHGRRNLSAVMSCLILIVLIVLPLTMILAAMTGQGITSFNNIQTWLAEGNLEKLLQKPLAIKISGIIKPLLPDFSKEQFRLDQSLIQITSKVGTILLDQGGFILKNITAFVAKFFLMVFVFFFMIRDGDQILKGLLHLVPLASSQERQIIDKIKAVSRSVLLGTLATAIAQGTAGGLALRIAGLPGLFWGTMMAFASLIPVVGTALIWVPAAGYLFLAGNWGYGLFVIIWCITVVGTIDSFLRPMFMKGSAGMSPLLIFFAILGGINCFGLLGILYGPLIFGIAMVLLYIYELEFSRFLKHQDQS
jgi:predicted PurR-regulated permease PerM